MMKLMAFLSRQSGTYLKVLGFVLVLLLGIIDYLTGPEFAFSIFYLLPISMVAWFVGRRSGIVISVAAAMVWSVADRLAQPMYFHPAAPYWNAAVRLGFFLIITCALSTLKASVDRQEELGQFIVHDLRSPLSNVIAGLHVMQDSTGATMSTIENDLMKICLMSCNQMLTLINSLLDLARLESGQMPLQLGATNARELVESSLEQVAMWAEHRQVTLTSHLDTSTEMVYADPDVTMRVLVNLLSNAIKFSRPQSVVTVCIEPPRTDMVALSITDQGPGISQEWTGRVFDKFAQVDAHRVGGSVGSGLGLAFCRLAVEAQGGRIWLTSETGVGTTVTFTLPIHAR